MAGLQAAWGLDVGITSLKAIKIRKDGDKVAVEAFEVIEHDKFLSEPEVDKDDLIRHTLRKFLERNQLRGEMVFVGVPGSSTFARFVKLPPVETKKIPEIVRFEAIQQIPFPLDQVNWDYQTFSNADSPDVEVGIFAMKKELVGQVLANFRSTGMTVHGVQMSPLAVYNAAAYDGLTDGKGTVLIDMGAEHTDLVIMDQGRLWLRTINIGGNHFTDALAKSFKQSFSRAEALKKTAATSKYQKQIFQAMRPIFADLVAEIQRSIGHYNSSHRDSKLERIVGMGNPFKLPNLQKYLQQELKMEVVRLDNFRKASAEPKMAAALNESILPMTAAYGLAVQGLGLATIDTNLLPIEIARQMMWRQKRVWFYATAAVMVAVAGMWTAQLVHTGSVFGSDARVAKAQENDNAIKAETDNKSMWAALKKAPNEAEVQELSTLGADRPFWPTLYLDFLDALPQAQRGAGRAESRGRTGEPADQRTIVLTQVSSEYSVKLSTAKAAAPENFSQGNLGDRGMRGGGFDRFDRRPGRDSLDQSGRQPSSNNVPAQPAPGNANEAAVAAARGDRGFEVTIQGYALPMAGGDSHRVVKDYQQALLARAKKESSGKPYYFVEDGDIEGHTAPPENPDDTSTSAQGVWGKDHGEYWDVFAADVAGIKLEQRPGQGGGPPETVPLSRMPAVDLFTARAGATPKDTRLEGSFVFTIKLKVFIRESAAAK